MFYKLGAFFLCLYLIEEKLLAPNVDVNNENAVAI